MLAYNKKKNFFHGSDIQVPAHLNLGKLFFDKIRLGGDKLAVLDDESGRKYTYKDLTQRAVDLAIAYKKLGMGSGDVVLLGTQSIEFVPVSLAILFTGATLFPSDSLLGRATLHRVLTVTSTSYVICDEAFWKDKREIFDDTTSVKAVVASDSSLPSEGKVKTLHVEHIDVNDFEPAEVQGQVDVAFINLSSGTTGFPKAVQLTHLNFIAQTVNDHYSSCNVGVCLAVWGNNYFDDKLYQFLVTLKTLIYVNAQSVEKLMKAVETYKIDIMFTYPTIINDIVKQKDLQKYDLSSLNTIMSTGSPLTLKYIESLKNKIPNVEVAQQYGMTEVLCVTTEMKAPRGFRNGSVGTVQPGRIVKVVDPRTGERLPANTKGEICIKGVTLMKGYIGIDSSTYLDEEGFFKTGDLGYYDEDGYFYIIDRLKDILIIGGDNFSPVYLETMLQLHPCVKEVGVVGKPTDGVDDQPAAFIVKQPNTHVTEQELIEFLRVEVATTARLTGGVYFVEGLPRNSRRKLLRRKLKEMLLTIII